jgi:hypothetical protein
MGGALKALRGVLQGDGANRRVLYYNDVVRIRSILTLLPATCNDDGPFLPLQITTFKKLTTCPSLNEKYLLMIAVAWRIKIMYAEIY